MGPRSCAICGPTIEGCWKCQATYGHAHITVVARTGAPAGQVAVCGDHAPKLPELRITAKRPAPAADAVVVKARKLAYDRARRAAIRDVLDAHPEAYRQALDRRTREVGR